MENNDEFHKEKSLLLRMKKKEADISESKNNRLLMDSLKRKKLKNESLLEMVKIAEQNFKIKIAKKAGGRQCKSCDEDAQRKHGSIGFMTPMRKWEIFYQRILFTFTRSSIAEAGNAGEQPARINLTNEGDQQGTMQITPCSSQSSLLMMPQKTQSVSSDASNEQTVANLTEKIVQFIGS